MKRGFQPNNSNDLLSEEFEEESSDSILKSEKQQLIDDGPGMIPIFNSHRNISIDNQRKQLPVYAFKNQILYLLETNRVLIIVGETGSGKSTQIPQYIYEAGWLNKDSIMAITQPRRIAVFSLASRIAEERNWKLGEKVGYAMRFEDCSIPGKTVLKFVTDGLLLRDIQSDPLLTKYSFLMIDEAHERSLNTDILIGLVKKILRKRSSDFRLIISSATLDAQKYYDFFNDIQYKTIGDDSSECANSLSNVCILSIQGRQFPVEIFYSKSPVPDYVQSTIDTVVELHKMQPLGGDVLCFVTGQEEVEKISKELIDMNRAALENSSKTKKMRVIPLYGSLAFRHQIKAFERPFRDMRKIIVATNIAEASVTLPNIVYVIDCGFHRMQIMRPDNGLEVIITTPISKASAVQRAGRAARTRSGKVYRLYTEDAFLSMSAQNIPEIQRCELSHTILQMKYLNINNFRQFEFFSQPPRQNLERSMELLFALGALDEDAQITNPLGKKMAELPIKPAYASVLFAATKYGCLKEACAITALTQIHNIFLVTPGNRRAAERCRNQFAAVEGDHLTQLNAFINFENQAQNLRRSWCDESFLNYRGLVRAVQVRDQLKKIFVDQFKYKWTSCLNVSPTQQNTHSIIYCEPDRDSSVGCSPEPILKALILGFFSQVALLSRDGLTYKTVRGDYELHLHPNSILYNASHRPKWVIFTDCSMIEDRQCMNAVTSIDPQLLCELAPHYYSFGTDHERMLDKDPAFNSRRVQHVIMHETYDS